MKTEISKSKLITIIIIAGYVWIANTARAQERVFDISEYGAKSGTESLQTEYIQAAIDAANNNGGGKVLISKGTFVCGSLVLKSNVNLHLEEGAVLLGSMEPRDYTKINHGMAFLLADNQENVSITGNGEINGRGRQVALNADSLHHSGIDIDPSYNTRRMRPNKRPKLMEFA